MSIQEERNIPSLYEGLIYHGLRDGIVDLRKAGKGWVVLSRKLQTAARCSSREEARDLWRRFKLGESLLEKGSNQDAT